MRRHEFRMEHIGGFSERERERGGERVSWCFEPSQPQRITSGLKTNLGLSPSYLAERTNEAEIRLGEQSENTESCRENLWNEIQVKGP